MTKVVVVYGPPASGKTTYVENRLTNNDLVYDYDSLMASLSGLPYQRTNDNLIPYILEIRKSIIDKLLNERQIDTAYIITTFIGRDLRNELGGLNVEYKKMDTDKETCIKRIKSSKRYNAEKLIRIVSEWFAKYNSGNNPVESPAKETLRPCKEFGCGNLTKKSYCKMHEKNAQETTRNYNRYKRNPIINAFYKSPEWRRVRLVALDRDNHLCKRCKSNGQLVKAEVVHHVIEIRDDWSLRLQLDNLESICHSCHNRIHKSTPGVRKF